MDGAEGSDVSIAIVVETGCDGVALDGMAGATVRTSPFMLSVTGAALSGVACAAGACAK